jgi:hypothetical protein
MQGSRAALNCQTDPSNMPLMALDRAPSKVTRSVCLQPPTSPCPLVPSFLAAGVSYSVLQDAQQKLRYQPFSLQISLDQGGRLLLEINCAGRLTGKLSTRNSSAAQPGRSQPRRHEAFLRLARSQRMEALPRQTDVVVIARRGIVMGVVIVRQRGERAEPVAMLRS